MKEYIRVPYGQTVHGEEEIEAVVKALRESTQMGKNVKAMERRVAQTFMKKHGVMVNSGSSANYLAIEILDLPEGSEVITPVLTFSTTVAPLIKNKLIPVFVDVTPGTYNIDVDQVESLITEKTKAMMIPNLLGNLPDWQKLRVIADQHNLILIEDSCDTLGAQIGDDPCGLYTDISVTSFYGSHVINCAGNGGMLCVNSDKLANKAKLLRSWGRSSSLFQESEKIENRFNISLDDIQYDAKFIFETIGYNYEPSEIGAAFGLVQLDKLDNNIKLREEWFAKHHAFFNQYKNWFVLPKQLSKSKTGWLAYPITIKEDAPFSRRDLQIFLEKRNIQTRAIFTGNILRQPGFNNIDHKKSPGGYACADQVMKGGMLLACHHGLNQKQLDHVHSSFKIFAKDVLKNVPGHKKTKQKVELVD